jgi:hypothetical protein
VDGNDGVRAGGFWSAPVGDAGTATPLGLRFNDGGGGISSSLSLNTTGGFAFTASACCFGVGSSVLCVGDVVGFTFVAPCTESSSDSSSLDP